MSDRETNRDHTLRSSTELEYCATHNYSEHKYPRWHLHPEVLHLMKLIQGHQMKKSWSICDGQWLGCLMHRLCVLQDFAVHLKNVMRPLSAAEINPITICKCYSCFPNRPALTLEACIYSHTWTKDKTECWYMCAARDQAVLYNTFHQPH